jgi:uncharacterized SAM-binding protein YcdF (DUF218 family)
LVVAGPQRINVWESLLAGLYKSLVRNDPVQPAGLILVLAGRMERKPYGLELYRAGVAPRLVLSIGRFEVSRMSRLDLAGVEDLQKLRDNTRPNERHFFMSLDASGVHTVKAQVSRRGTYGEALSFRHYLEGTSVRTVMVVSTAVHLRRAALTYAKVFRGASVEFLYCPVPAPLASFNGGNWWIRPEDRRFVLKEMIKLAGYQLILSAPEWVSCRLMRRRD